MSASSGWAADAVAAGRAAGTMPAYGTGEWLDLPLDDPRRLAALVIAAECWWAEGLPDVMAERLRDDLALTDHIVRERIRRASWDVAAAQDWTAAAARPTHDELEARRRHRGAA